MTTSKDLPAQCCGFCRYWMRDPNTITQGLCRRYPPTPMLVGMAQSAIVADPNRAPLVPMINSFFPQMLETGFCGEFGRTLNA